MFDLTQGFQNVYFFESTTNGLGVMSTFAVLIAVAPPIGFDRFSQIEVYHLAKF